MAIQFSCPHCNATHVVDNECVGHIGVCHACAGRYVVPPIAQPMQEPKQFDCHTVDSARRIREIRERGRRRARRNAIVISTGVIIATVAVLGFLAWNARSKTVREADLRNGDVFVFIDNGTKNGITVVIDGESRKELPKGSAVRLLLRHGSRRIALKQGGEVIQDELRELVPSARDGKKRKYLLVVGESNIYAKYAVDYKGGVTIDIPRIFVSEQEAREHRERVYREMLPELVHLDKWTDVSIYDYVLAKPPTKISIESRLDDLSVEARRSVLTKLSSSDVRFIEDAQAKFSPTESDLVSLQRFMARISGIKH
jgi:hypothetical protein